MANIKAVLRINDDGNGVIESWITSDKTNNLSQYPHQDNITTFATSQTTANRDYPGGLATALGSVRVGDLSLGITQANNTKSESYTGLNFGYTDSNSNYNLTFLITGTDIISFAIHFDPLRNQYPVNYTWWDSNGDEHIVTGNTSNVIRFENMLAGYGTKRIMFTKWSRANYSIGITYIENLPIDVFLNKQWIMSMKTQSQKTSNPDQIEYRAIANTGEIVLRDYKNELYNKAQLGYLNVYVFNLELYINNKLLQTHISNQSPYYAEDGTLQIQLTNKLDYWNKTEVPNISFNATTLYDVLHKLFEYDLRSDGTRSYTVNEVDEMLSSDMLDTDVNGDYFETSVIEKLMNINIPSFTLKKGTLLQQMEKVCVSAQLQCYIDDNGNIKFVNARPLHDFNSLAHRKAQTIIIPYNKQYSVLNYDMLTANRYDSVEFN